MGRRRGVPAMAEHAPVVEQGMEPRLGETSPMRPGGPDSQKPRQARLVCVCALSTGEASVRVVCQDQGTISPTR